MENATRQSTRTHGEPWALGSVLGYASANIFDRMAVAQADPLLGPFLRGLPSLLLGLILARKFDQIVDDHRVGSGFGYMTAVCPEMS